MRTYPRLVVTVAHVVVVDVCIGCREAQTALHTVVQSGFYTCRFHVVGIYIAHIVALSRRYIFVRNLIAEAVVVCRQREVEASVVVFDRCRELASVFGLEVFVAVYHNDACHIELLVKFLERGNAVSLRIACTERDVLERTIEG